LYLSVEEREVIRAGAALAGMAPGGFAARAAVDAALAGVVPVGARSGLERLAGFQLELAAARRVVDGLRSQLAAADRPDQAGAAGEAVWRRCGEAAERLTRLAGVIHRQLGGGG
jgi:hypothetical protein